MAFPHHLGNNCLYMYFHFLLYVYKNISKTKHIFKIRVRFFSATSTNDSGDLTRTLDSKVLFNFIQNATSDLQPFLTV